MADEARDEFHLMWVHAPLGNPQPGKDIEMNTYQKIQALESLRGTHDMTMRCGIAKIMTGNSKKGHTKQFLEKCIKDLKDSVLADGALWKRPAADSETEGD